MEGSCAFMAARLKQAARDQKRVMRAATMGVLRDVVGMAEQRYSMSGALARNVWGVTSRRGVWRKNYWRGRKVTQKSLGLSSRTKARDRTGAKWARWARDYDRGRVAADRVRQRAGQKAGAPLLKVYPLIVRIAKTRWRGDVLETGVVSRGIAGNIEGGIPFKPHMRGGKMQRGVRGRFTQSAGARMMHPGGAVHRHPVLTQALNAHRTRLSSNVRAAVDGFLKGALGG